MAKVSVVDEYFKYQSEYTQKYGNKTLVFMQVGSFYEAYSTDVEGFNLNIISQLINVIRTKKSNKDPNVNNKNPYMLGFPIVSLAERLRILTENGFTVIIFDQLEENQHITRKVAGIYTPAINIMSYVADTRFIMSIYIKEEKQIKTKSITAIGASVCDVTTGNTCVYETYSTIEEANICFDNIQRFIHAHPPKELLILNLSSKYDSDYIKSCLDISHDNIKFLPEINPHFTKIMYQQEVIKKIYPKYGLLNPLEYIGLTKLPYCTISFMILLDYINSVDSTMLFKVGIPTVFCETPNLYIGNNALLQLNIFENKQLDVLNKNITCLFDIIDHTSTPLGRRYLKAKLNTPFVDTDVLNKIYDITEELTNNKKYCVYVKLLNQIGDIEKMYRKIVLKIVKPDEFFMFIQSLNHVQLLLNTLQQDEELIKLLELPSNIDRLRFFIKKIRNIFVVDNLKSSIETETYYQTDVHEDIDNLYKELCNKMSFVENLRLKLSQLLGRENLLSTKKNDRDGYFFNITKIRAEQLHKELSNIKTFKIGDIEINAKDVIFKCNPSGTVKITTAKMDTNSDDIVLLQNELKAKVREYFLEDVEKIISKYHRCIKNIISLIAQFDYYVSNAKTAVLCHYSKPIIEKQDYGFVQCEQLRHPVIEKLIEHEYIPHDLTLGKDNLKGILLYGLNSSGKSSMMKAVGISIIMAQAGMFVPASKFIYSPYTTIFTRISGNDNIFKELSSFSVEMVELKAIWKRSNSTTLVIGDEVCRGTEHVSGNAIVASTLIKLSKVNSTFIFATHLHDLVKLKQIHNIKNIKAFHLSVTYDGDKDRLVFDRQLKEGDGEEIYGITVAKYIIQDDEFTQSTNNIKDELLGITTEVVPTKQSKYSTKLYIDKCQICNKQLSSKDDIINLCVHHIHHQEDCENGVVKNKKYIRKNAKCNIITICRSCHSNVHDGKINIDKIVKSTDGNIIQS